MQRARSRLSFRTLAALASLAFGAVSPLRVECRGANCLVVSITESLSHVPMRQQLLGFHLIAIDGWYLTSQQEDKW
jgi:hypothetical protein